MAPDCGTGLHHSRLRVVCRACSVLLLILGLAARVLADWPTYMHDPARSGITTDALQFPLREQWVYRAPAAPKTAWPDPQEDWTELPKCRFDDALYTVAAGDTLYFGSSIDNAIYALDAASGKVRWQFFTGGPVRLAPTIAGGRVYTGSDDGYVYCLNAADGQVIWTYRGWPNAQRLLGSGRMISLWPIRTGVIVDGDVAYFGAGVFRSTGQAMVALQAEDGKVLWRNDNPGDKIDFTPQGYLLASDTRLFTTSARIPPIGFSRQDGARVWTIDRKATPAKGMAAGVYELLADNLLYAGTQNALFGFDQETGKRADAWLDSRRMVITPNTYYILKGLAPPAYGRIKPDQVTDITAVDRAAWSKRDPQDEKAQQKCTRWRFARPGLDSMILAGTTIIAGGDREVVAVDATTGKERWSAPVDGRAAGLTVTGGRLFVSTDTGAIYTFGLGEPALPAPKRTEDYLTAGPAEIERTAQAIVKDTGCVKGFCLVLGRDSARLAAALAKQTDLQIYCLEPDPAKIQLARRALSAAGLSGTRVTVDQGQPATLPYADYFANLVIADAGMALSAEEILRMLKPCGGILLVGAFPGNAGASPLPDTAAWQAAGELRPAYALPGAGTWLKLARGPLDGAGKWTHEYANFGNTASSDDRRVKEKLDVLWYGDPGPADVPDRHLRGIAPLSINGRVFYQGFRFKAKQNYVGCFDAYNGTKYWERVIPGAYRVSMSNETGSMACTADSVFVIVKSSCVRIDAATGEIIATYEAPPAPDGSARQWGYIAVDGPLLFGSTAKTPEFSDTVFAIDTRTGKQCWLYRGKEIRNNTFAISNGRLLFAELRGGEQPEAGTADAEAPAEEPGDAEEQPEAKTDDAGKAAPAAPEPPYLRTVVALDTATGNTVWAKEVDFADCGPWGSQLLSLSADGVIVFCGAYSPYGRRTGKEPLRRAAALSVADGTLLWNAAIGNISRPLIMGGNLAAEPYIYDLHTGKPVLEKGKPLRLNSRSGACGPRSASASMTFYRAGFVGWYDVDAKRTGMMIGLRPGCWINIIAANGVAIELEASSGCSCYHALQCTVVYKP